MQLNTNYLLAITKNIPSSLLVLFIACLALVLIPSCKDKSATDHKVTSQAKKTQVVLKIQPHSYDNENKTNITGTYVTAKKVEVPKQLSGQNKWIMFEGPVLENDKIAYRYYADTRHRFDIFGKKVSDLVMDTVSWDYHGLMDWGSDILKVGSSLGIGSPAIVYQDSVYPLENWDRKTIEVLTTKDDQAAVRTTFYDLEIGGELLTIQQDWSLSAGDFHSTINLRSLAGPLPSDMKFATGIVKHLDKMKIVESSNSFSGYTWGTQSFHKQNLGMAIFTNKYYIPKSLDNSLSHIFIFDEYEGEVSYNFMAVWAEGVGAINSEAAFKTLLKDLIK